MLLRSRCFVGMKRLGTLRSQSSNSSTTALEAEVVTQGEGLASSESIVDSPEPPTRNISRLRERHLAMAEGRIAPVTYEWERNRYAKRERFGRYGLASGVNLSQLWPSIEEVEEDVSMSLCSSYTEALQSSTATQEKAKAAVKARLEKLDKNEANYTKVLAKFNASKVKAEKEKGEKEEKLEKRIREIQEYFGYWIDPKDPRFEVMLAQKDADEKKAEKLAKRQAAEKRTIAAVVGGSETQK